MSDDLSLDARMALAHHEKALQYADRVEQHLTSRDQHVVSMLERAHQRKVRRALRDAGFTERTAQRVVQEVLDPEARRERLEAQARRNAEAREIKRLRAKPATIVAVSADLEHALKFIREDASAEFQQRIITLVMEEKNHGNQIVGSLQRASAG